MGSTAYTTCVTCSPNIPTLLIHLYYQCQYKYINVFYLAIDNASVENFHDKVINIEIAQRLCKLYLLDPQIRFMTLTILNDISTIIYC